jgi:hypothetical protein
MLKMPGSQPSGPNIYNRCIGFLVNPKNMSTSDSSAILYDCSSKQELPINSAAGKNYHGNFLKQLVSARSQNVLYKIGNNNGLTSSFIKSRSKR